MNKYIGKILNLSALFLAFQVEGCLRGSNLLAGVQVGMVLGVLGFAPFVLWRMVQILQNQFKINT